MGFSRATAAVLLGTLSFEFATSRSGDQPGAANLPQLAALAGTAGGFSAELIAAFRTCCKNGKDKRNLGHLRPWP